MTVIHVAEMANIVEARLGPQASLKVVARILSSDNIEVADVSREDYEKALAIASLYIISLNDALAYIKWTDTLHQPRRPLRSTPSFPRASTGGSVHRVALLRR